MWRIKILRALGSNARVLCDVLPELSRLIGEQPPVPPLGTAETANRFSMVLLQFVSCLATARSPLTLFIDDLQWADGGSLALLKLLITRDTGSLLVIGAYRDNEVDEAHPLTRVINEIKESDPERVTEVCLQPLAAVDIQHMLIDSFRCEQEPAAQLAQILLHRTQGNPFHITQLLTSYHDLGLIYFDFQGGGQWRWDLESILLTPVQDDVVDLVCNRMLTLSRDAQQLLQYAACSGNKFSLLSLQIVTQLDTGRISRAAFQLEQSGLLLCISHAHELLLLSERSFSPGAPSAGNEPSSLSSRSSGGSVDSPAPFESRASASSSDSSVSSSSSASSCSSSAHAAALLPLPLTDSSTSALLSSIMLQFTHDKVQSAAFKLIPAGEVSRVHCVIATQLLAHYEQAELEAQHAIDVAGHINVGWMEANSQQGADCWTEFFDRAGTLERVIQLELMAGKQASASSAYASAINFFTATLRLLQLKAHRSDASAAFSVPVLDSVSAAADEFLRVDGVCWSMSYDLCVQVYHELAKCVFLRGQIKEAQHCIEYALDHIHAISDRSANDTPTGARQNKRSRG